MNYITARLATLDQLLDTLIPAYLAPPPCRDTLRDWFVKAADALAQRDGKDGRFSPPA